MERVCKLNINWYFGICFFAMHDVFFASAYENLCDIDIINNGMNFGRNGMCEEGKVYKDLYEYECGEYRRKYGKYDNSEVKLWSMSSSDYKELKKLTLKMYSKNTKGGSISTSNIRNYNKFSNSVDPSTEYSNGVIHCMSHDNKDIECNLIGKFNAVIGKELEIEERDSIQLLSKEKEPLQPEYIDELFLPSITKPENEIQIIDQMEILKTKKPDNQIGNIESIELLPSRIWTTIPSEINKLTIKEEEKVKPINEIEFTNEVEIKAEEMQLVITGVSGCCSCLSNCCHRN